MEILSSSSIFFSSNLLYPNYLHITPRKHKEAAVILLTTAQCYAAYYLQQNQSHQRTVFVIEL